MRTILLEHEHLPDLFILTEQEWKDRIERRLKHGTFAIHEIVVQAANSLPSVIALILRGLGAPGDADPTLEKLSKALTQHEAHKSILLIKDWERLPLKHRAALVTNLVPAENEDGTDRPFPRVFLINAPT